MSIKRYEFPGTIEIMDIGDVHRGSKACDVDLFHKTINYVADHDNCYWVSTSDILETALRKDSFGAIYHSMTLQEELDCVVDELRPIANKCLGFVASNHHKRLEKSVGLNLDLVLSQRLNIPFLGVSGIIQAVCDKNSYFIHMHHGMGGGSTPGAKTNASFKTSNVLVDADLYLSGHTHCYNHFSYEVDTIDRKRNKVATVLSHFVTTGHYLTYEKCYAIEALYKKAPKCAALITLKGHSSGFKKLITPRMYM